jgi:hypothetical protein
VNWDGAGSPSTRRLPRPVPSYGPKRQPVGMDELSNNLQGTGFANQSHNWNPMPFNPSGTISHTAGGWNNADEYQEG